MAEEMYTDLHDCIINLDNQQIDYDCIVHFPDSDEVADNVIEDLTEWDLHSGCDNDEVIIKVARLILNWLMDSINETSSLCRFSIFWGLYEEMCSEIKNLETLISRFRFTLNKGFHERSEIDNRADLLYLLLSFVLERSSDLPLGTLTGYDVEEVYSAYDAGNI